MKQTFKIQSKPFSLNSWLDRSKRMTKEARKWKQETIDLLRDLDFSHLRDFFDPKLHYYTLSMTCYYPKEIFFTKSGALSSRTFDTSNVVKNFEDILFGQSNFGTSYYNFQNLNSNDKYVLDSHSFKRVSPDSNHYIEFVIEIIPLSTISE